MMRYLLLAITFIFLFGTVKAQDEAIFTHYHINPVLINPGAAGFNDMHKLHLNGRFQSTGFPGSPETYALSYNGKVSESFGLGAMLFKEEIASLSRTRVQLNYAFQFDKFENIKLGIGFSTEFESNRVPSSYMENPLVDSDDILLMETTEGKSYFDASLGVFGRYKEKTFFGLSFPNLISQRIDNIGTNGIEEDTGFAKYYMLTGGHAFEVEGLNFILEPSILIRKAKDAPFGVDFNVKAKYLEEKIITGLSYRSGTGGNLGLLLGSKLDVFRIYYSYDVAFQRFQRYNSGSHEVTLSFEFGKNKDRSAKHR